MMENISLDVRGDKLVIEVDLTKPGSPSSTGKTNLIATTRGAVPIHYAKRPGLKVAINITVPS
jgi:hypothetical protein